MGGGKQRGKGQGKGLCGGEGRRGKDQKRPEVEEKQETLISATQMDECHSTGASLTHCWATRGLIHCTGSYRGKKGDQRGQHWATAGFDGVRSNG